MVTPTKLRTAFLKPRPSPPRLIRTFPSFVATVPTLVRAPMRLMASRPRHERDAL
jgi:hypothetical protein